MRDFAKNAVATGLTFGVLMSFVFGSSLYGNIGIAACPYYSCLAFSTGAGLVCGLLFGILMALAIRSISRQRYMKFDANNPCKSNETLIKKGEAVCMMRFRGVGGYLYLTNRRLLFLAESKADNAQLQELSIELRNITSIRFVLISGLIPSGLEIVTDSRKDRFALTGRARWRERIQEVLDQEYSRYI